MTTPTLDPHLLKRHYRLLAIAYMIIAVLAVIAMFMNVKTVPVNDAVQTTKKKYQIVYDDNARRKLELAQTVTLKTVEERMMRELNMTYPTSFMYIDQNGHVLDKNGSPIVEELPDE